MGKFKRIVRKFGSLTAAACLVNGALALAESGPQPQMPQIIQEFSADLGAIDSTYRVQISLARSARLEKFYSASEANLSAINFDSLSHDDQIDYLLLRSFITTQQHQLTLQKIRIEQMAPLLPFDTTIEELMEKKRLMQHPDAEQDAKALTEMVKQIKASRGQLEASLKSEAHADASQKPKIDPVVANRAARTIDPVKRDCAGCAAFVVDGGQLLSEKHTVLDARGVYVVAGDDARGVDPVSIRL